MLNSLIFNTMSDRGLRCPICQNFCLLSKNANQCFIKCENGHERTCYFTELSKLINDTKKNIKIKCNHKISKYDDIYFCNECQENFCIKCSKKHFDEKKHKIERISEIGKKCREHGELIGYFCKICFKHFCEKCKNKHLNHEIIDLIEYRKNITINEIKKLQEKYNKEILKMNEKLREINKEFQKKSDEIVKKSIENLKLKNIIYETFQNTKNNYFNIENIDFVNSNITNEYNTINNLDVKKIINIIFDDEKTNLEEINSINKINNNIINNKKIKEINIPKNLKNKENSLIFEENDKISSKDSTKFTNEKSLKTITNFENNQNMIQSPIKYTNKNNINKLRNSTNIYDTLETGISSQKKLSKNKNLTRNKFKNNKTENNQNISGYISQVKLHKKQKSSFYEISNKQPITNMIHIVDNIILLTLNTTNETNIQIYEINYNSQIKDKLNNTLNINVHKRNIINYIMKYNKSNWVFLSCSKDYLSIFEVNYLKKSYEEKFTFSNKPCEITKFDYSFNLCYFIDNHLFFTTGTKSGLTYWKKNLIENLIVLVIQFMIIYILLQ